MEMTEDKVGHEGRQRRRRETQQAMLGDKQKEKGKTNVKDLKRADIITSAGETNVKN